MKKGLLLLGLIQLSSVNCEPLLNAKIKYEPLKPSESYTHQEYIDEDNQEQYKIFWKFLSDDEIQFEVHCKTTGWVGLGISTSGSMRGSDIAIGWYNNEIGNGYLKDCHATKNEAPKVDNEQNWYLIDAAEVNGYTILKYKRKLLTCDSAEDTEIKVGTTYMIFAWNDKDPDCDNWEYHDKNRVTKAILLLNYKDQDISQQNNLPADTFTLDLKMRDVLIQPKDTYYYCDFYKLEINEEKVHLIQFEMLVNKKNKQFVHHLVGYLCEEGFNASTVHAQECGSVPLPTHIAQKCQTTLFIAWGIGGQYNYSFPHEAGFPFSRSTYVMIEFHYDNPRLEEGHVDDSGVRLYLTKTLRQHDLGLLGIGVDGLPLSLQLPAKIDDFLVTTFCYPECTSKYIPDSGINVVSALLHTHLAGRSVDVSLVRDGKIISTLFENPNYDFNNQYLLDIKPTKIYKGDALISRCKYNTEDRSKFTLYGFGTHDEMCSHFVYYYPKIQFFTTCMSPYTIETVFSFYESLMKDSLMPTVSLEITEENLYKIIDIVKNNISSTNEIKERFKEFYRNENNLRNIYCGSPGSLNESLIIPNVETYKPTGTTIQNKECDPTSYKEMDCSKSMAAISQRNLFLTFLILYLLIKLF